MLSDRGTWKEPRHAIARPLRVIVPTTRARTVAAVTVLGATEQAGAHPNAPQRVGLEVALAPLGLLAYFGERRPERPPRGEKLYFLCVCPLSTQRGCVSRAVPPGVVVPMTVMSHEGVVPTAASILLYGCVVCCVVFFFLFKSQINIIFPKCCSYLGCVGCQSGTPTSPHAWGHGQGHICGVVHGTSASIPRWAVLL